MSAESACLLTGALDVVRPPRNLGHVFKTKPLHEVKRAQLMVRPGADVVARVDAYAKASSDRCGLTVRRGSVALAALVAGLELLERRAEAEEQRRTEGPRVEPVRAVSAA